MIVTNVTFTNILASNTLVRSILSNLRNAREH